MFLDYYFNSSQLSSCLLVCLVPGCIIFTNWLIISRYQTAKDFITYELGLSDEIENVALKVKNVVEESEKVWQEKRLKYKVYVAVPTSQLVEFQMAAFKMNINYTIEQIFYPHISTEAMPDFSMKMLTNCDSYHSHNCQLSNNLFSLTFIIEYFSHIIQQCGLSVIKINKYLQ